MRIGIYDPYLDDGGGGEKYMMNIVQCLSKDNAVDIFWNNKVDLETIAHRFGIDFSKTKLAPNIFAPGVSVINRMLATKKYDAIFFLSDGSIPLVLSKKLFIHIQQPLEQMQTGSLLSRIKLSRVNLFFCNSEFTRSFISGKFGLKTAILYPPVELKAKNIKKENIILHVGRFRVKDVISKAGDYKKQSVMIDTFKDMVKKGLKNWKFVLAVSVLEKDQEAFNEMAKKAKDFPIEFIINQTNEKLWEVYSKAKIYWHASGFGEDLQKHPEFAEHFGISTVEAMGGGAVPVVINAGGQKEIVTEGKNGFLWDTVDELKDKTLRLINDKKLITKLSSDAKKSSEKFSEINFCQKINDLLND